MRSASRGPSAGTQRRHSLEPGRGADTEDLPVGVVVQKLGFDLLGRRQERRSQKDPQDGPGILQIALNNCNVLQSLTGRGSLGHSAAD